MPMFHRKFQLQNMPSTPVTPIEQDSSADEGSNNMMPSTPTSHQSSSERSVESKGSGSGRWQNRRRRRGTPRNTEKRPYHSPTHVSPPHDKPMTKNDIYFALDCEMVGIGPEGLDSAVARVTICNWAEKVVLDTFVKVSVKVTDYRTFVSGIKAKHLESDKAVPLEEVQKMVKDILHGKILIGHALDNDLAALQITHPWHDIRDTANYAPFMKEGSEADKSNLRPRKLKELVSDKLGRDIQTMGVAHDPIEDARAALGLYKIERMDWEKLVMKQVASARTQEGREGEPSGREKKQPAAYNPVRPASATPPGIGQQNMRQNNNMNYTQANSIYFRSRSAPTTMMTPQMTPPPRGYDHQGYEHPAYRHQPRRAYYPQQQLPQQQHYLY